jgi:ABC-type polysaccharide/polyol phosphate transport system ATPase subunit
LVGDDTDLQLREVCAATEKELRGYHLEKAYKFMGNVIISVENLGKCYRINHQQSGSNDGLRHVLNHWAMAPLRALRAGRQKSEAISPSPSTIEDFWALRDVSIEIKQGEVVGIIGRNGAGKSTLLKILSRITEPTQGRVRIKGRVASLLEVGTGFHPELTGRENVYLNGAILGMSRMEIKKKFDEIVAFAEVEKFLDTPVKRYSSGMYVRLAFAVAAHLEPEILIVDEVLAVGDAQFQRKCLGKMQEVSDKEGRTVLFVSHNIASITSLTQQVVLLHEGQIQFKGPTEQGLTRYLTVSNQKKGEYDSLNAVRNKPFISKVRINFYQQNSHHISGDEMEITFDISHIERPKSACLSFQIVNQYQHPVLHCWIFDADTHICRHGNSTRLRCRLPRLALNVGQYSLNTYLSEPPGGDFYEKLEHICEFEVVIVKKQTLFGWRPDACAYIENYEWTIA